MDQFSGGRSLNEVGIRYWLFWLDLVKNTKYEDNTHLWGHAVNILTFFIGGSSLEAINPNAEQKIKRKIASTAGFITAIRLGLNEPEFAEELFGGAIDEREKCDDETLIGRLNWIRGTIARTWSKNQARSSN